MSHLANDETGFIIDYEQFFIGNLATVIHQLGYEADAYRDGLYDTFAIDKPTDISAWLPQRRAQYLAGRILAKQAMHPTQASSEQVAIGKHREPIWPERFAGSISHSQQITIATVKQQCSTQLGLGIDIQSIIDIKTQSAISQTILTQQDQQLMERALLNLEDSMLFTLIFSAKESFFKALFNTVKAYFDFDVVSIVAANADQQTLTLRADKPLGRTIPQGFEVEVCFDCLNTKQPQIITLCDWELSVNMDGQ